MTHSDMHCNFLFPSLCISVGCINSTSQSLIHVIWQKDSSELLLIWALQSRLRHAIGERSADAVLSLLDIKHVRHENEAKYSLKGRVWKKMSVRHWLVLLHTYWSTTDHLWSICYLSICQSTYLCLGCLVSISGESRALCQLLWPVAAVAQGSFSPSK